MKLLLKILLSPLTYAVIFPFSLLGFIITSTPPNKDPDSVSLFLIATIISAVLYCVFTRWKINFDSKKPKTSEKEVIQPEVPSTIPGTEIYYIQIDESPLSKDYVM